MNAPLPEPTGFVDETPKPIAPQKRAPLGLTLMCLASALVSVAWQFVADSPVPVGDDASGVLNWLSRALSFGMLAQWLALLFFLWRGVGWVRWLAIGMTICLNLPGLGLLALLPEPLSPIESGLRFVDGATSIWLLIYLFLPRVRAYFAAK